MDKKIVKLDQPYYAQAIRRDSLDLPNHLKTPISSWQRYFVEPIHRSIAGLKRLIHGLWTLFKVAVFTLGLVALYYLVNYHRGWIDVTILSQGELKQMSGDLLKDKPVKQVKK